MPAAHIVLQKARSRFLLLKSSRTLAMTGPGTQQNTTTPGSPLAVGNAHTNGDEEPLFLGVCFTHSALNCSTTWVACFVVETSSTEYSLGFGNLRRRNYGERMKSSFGRYSGLLRVVDWLWPGFLHRAARGRFSVLHGTFATVVFQFVWEPLKPDWKALPRVWRCNEPCVSTHLARSTLCTLAVT